MSVCKVNNTLYYIFFILVSLLILTGCSSAPKFNDLTSIVENTTHNNTNNSHSIIESIPGTYTNTEDSLDVNPPSHVKWQYKDNNRLALHTRNRKKDIKINLKNVTVSKAAKVIIGDILKLNFIVSGKIKQRVSIQTSRPISKDDVLYVFDSALQIVGATIRRNQNIIEIIPTEDNNILPIYSDVRKSSFYGLRTHIIPLRYISPKEFSLVIKNILPKILIKYSNDERGIIIVSGTNKEILTTLNLVDTFDVNWMKYRSYSLFKITNSKPDELVLELREILKRKNEKGFTNKLKLIPNNRLESILIIGANKNEVDTAKSWIKTLEYAGRHKKKKLIVYRCQNRNAQELSNILEGLLNSRNINTKIKNKEEASTSPKYDKISEVDFKGNIGNRFLPKNIRNTPKNNEYKNKSTRNSNIKIVPDTKNDSIFIEAPIHQHRRIYEILYRIDITPPQVLLESVIAEVNLNDELKYGVKWYFRNKRHKFTFTDAVTGVVASQFPGFSYLLQSNNITASIDALSSITKVNIVSAPSLMVMHNRRAILQIGDQVPIIKQTSKSVTNPDAPIINSIEQKDTGIILSVTPKIKKSGRIMIDIEQEVSSVVETTTSGIDSPTIQQRKIKTSVIVQDKQPIALGGIIQNRTRISKKKLPVLGNIPIIGSAFTNKDDDINKTELVIFIKPTIVRNPNEGDLISNEFKRRFRNVTTEPLRGRNNIETDLERIFR